MSSSAGPTQTTSAITGINSRPLYTVTTRAGVPSGEDKATLAGELAAFHSEYVGVPKNRGHIVFQGYAPGSGFAAGEVAAQR